VQLEYELLNLQDQMTANYITDWQAAQIVGDGDLTDVDWVMNQVNARSLGIKAMMRTIWIEIVKPCIVLLARRHLERTAPAL
jgi:hypothetical protein